MDIGEFEEEEHWEPIVEPVPHEEPVQQPQQEPVPVGE